MTDLPAVTVTLPGLVLTNSETGTDPYLSDLDGWYDSVDNKLEVLDWPNSDGASDQDPVYDRPRFPVVSGRMVTVDPTAVFDLRSQVMGLKGYPGQFEMSVTDPNGTRTAMVQLAGKISFAIDRVDGVVRFEIPLLATDPLQYGATLTGSTGLPTSGGGLEYNLFAGGAGGALYYGANGALGRITLANEGDATVWPFISVTGALTTGFYVQRIDTGEVVRYDRLVPAGGTVSIDFRTGEVLVDSDSDGSAYLTRYEFFSIAPGESFEVQFNAIAGSSGSPMMTVSWAPGYH